jgi:hypothetical protein
MPSPSAEAALAKARPHPVERWRDAWQMPFLLLLASCTGRSIYEDAERTVPLTKITSSSLPFSSLVSQQSGGEILLSPPDPKLNPDPVQVDFNPAPFLPDDTGAVTGWGGRAGAIEGLALNPVTGRLTGLPVASTTVFLRATTETGVEIDVVLGITLRTVLGDSSATSSQALNGTDDAAWLILGSPEDDTLTGGERSDDIRGGDGNDILDGGPGPDLFYGGAGIDTVS